MWEVYVTAVVLGVLGALTHWLVELYEKGLPAEWGDLALQLAIGGIAAFTWQLAGMPNHFNYFMAGYFGPSIIRHLAKRSPISKLAEAGE